MPVQSGGSAAESEKKEKREENKLLIRCQSDIKSRQILKIKKKKIINFFIRVLFYVFSDIKWN